MFRKFFAVRLAVHPWNSHFPRLSFFRISQLPAPRCTRFPLVEPFPRIEGFFLVIGFFLNPFLPFRILFPLYSVGLD